MRYWKIILLLGLVPAAWATPRTAGEALALHGAAGIPACASCHGVHGGGRRDQGYPRLAGLNAQYLLHELQSFQNSSRQNGIMQPIAKRLTPAQMTDVVAWFASLPLPPPPPVHVATATLARGAEIARHGQWSQGIPACENCHGPGAVGVGSAFPRLAGQYAGYMETELHNWRRGFRRNDPLGVMRSVAQRLSAADIHAVSVYLASLPRASVVPLPPPSPIARQPLYYQRVFQPPPRNAIPAGPLGVAIRRGRRIFDHTPQQAHPFVGDALSCRNCHVASGRKAGAAPMWAAYVAFPAYRTKNNQVNTLAQRVQGCFRFSENGQPPAQHSPTMTNLLAYFAWLARGAPVGAQMAGRGYPPLANPAAMPSPARGAVIYRGHCAVCHGIGGGGTTAGQGVTVFPPLWGPHSYNAGAGMHAVKNAAAFVHANMPYGAPGTLSVQQAWDVAAFVNSRPRPPDPRQAKGLAH